SFGDKLSQRHDATVRTARHPAYFHVRPPLYPEPGPLRQPPPHLPPRRLAVRHRRTRPPLARRRLGPGLAPREPVRPDRPRPPRPVGRRRGVASVRGRQGAAAAVPPRPPHPVGRPPDDGPCGLCLHAPRRPSPRPPRPPRAHAVTR